jgi:tRNA(Arg) A34 adenosine deaminase TadA
MVESISENHTLQKTRRRLLKQLLTIGGVTLTSTALPIRLTWSEMGHGESTRTHGAQDVDSGDQPYGAVVVKDGHIVGEGPSRVVTRRDPTAHAEMEAIRDAAKRLGTRDLSGCTIYATSKPCRMCETAAYWANLSRIYYSASLTDGGSPRYSSC